LVLFVLVPQLVLLSVVVLVVLARSLQPFELRVALPFAL
jgi:hypothetical protein